MTTELWGIMAHRSRKNGQGDASSWLKNDKGRIEFSSEKEALDYAIDLNCSIISPNVHYQAKRIL